MKEIQKNIAAKKKEVSCAKIHGFAIVIHMVILRLRNVLKPGQTQSAVHPAGDGQAVGLCHGSQLQGWCHSHVDKPASASDRVMVPKSAQCLLIVSHTSCHCYQTMTVTSCRYCTQLSGLSQSYIQHTFVNTNTNDLGSSHGYYKLYQVESLDVEITRGLTPSYRLSWCCMQVLHA